MHAAVCRCWAPTHNIAERVLVAVGSTQKRQAAPLTALPRAVKFDWSGLHVSMVVAL
jgi:hypothetical protein